MDDKVGPEMSKKLFLAGLALVAATAAVADRARAQTLACPRGELIDGVCVVTIQRLVCPAGTRPIEGVCVVEPSDEPFAVGESVRGDGGRGDGGRGDDAVASSSSDSDSDSDSDTGYGDTGYGDTGYGDADSAS